MKTEDRAGITITVIVHLVVLIFLLLLGLGRELAGDNSFLIDFSQQEEPKVEKKVEIEESFEEKISRKLDALLNSGGNTAIHNVAVSSELRDDRHSSSQARDLMNDAQRLANDLNAGFKADVEEDAVDNAVDMHPVTVEKEKHEYSGPSVLSWTLTGRKASHLPIPAYRCYGAGTVSVAIAVDQKGYVVNVRINDSISSDDSCLRDFALNAAKSSRFNRDLSAPIRQAGEIVYSFIAQ